MKNTTLTNPLQGTTDCNCYFTQVLLQDKLQHWECYIQSFIF